MEKINTVLSKNLLSKIICVLIISLAGILLYVGLQVYTDSMYQYYSRSFQLGQIADENLLVNDSVDILDVDATNKKKEENMKAVLPIFVYSVDKTLDSIKKYDAVRVAMANNDFATVSEICGNEVASYFKNHNDSLLLTISYEILTKILDKGYINYEDIQNVLAEGYNQVTFTKESKDSVLNLNSSVITDYNIHQILDDYIAYYEVVGLSVTQANAIHKFVYSLLETNVFFDEIHTDNKRIEVAEATESVYVSFEKGQVLLEKDRVITAEQLNLLKLLGSNTKVTAYDIIGESIFIILTITFSMFLFCFLLESEKYHSVQYLWITTVALVVTCVLSFFLIQQATYFGISFVEACIPVCFAPVLITMITGKRKNGYVTSFIVGLLISATPGSTYLTVIYCTLCGISASSCVSFLNRRTDMVVQWIENMFFTSALTALFIFIGAFSNQELLKDIIANVIHVSFSQILIIVFLPILERLFNLPTVFRLNELAYGNNPLLAKLSDVAPGTYSHSKMVSELAEAASKSIGLNALLSKVGGLFHDIGKIEHPEYFVENQTGTNLHQDLNPGLSVAIIKSHVKVGADKGRESGLPVEIIDIIANHHGNDIIAYFYNEAKKQADEDDIVSSNDFSYSSSSIPETKECALVMLADSVEAAARTISEPSTARFTKLINSIVFGKIERGQLDNCDLSMKEIDTIKESFLKTLSAQYHSRIEYPDEEEDK